MYACVRAFVYVLTQLAGGLDVDVVYAGADAHNDPERLELLQVLLGEYDGVPHESADCLVQHLLVYFGCGLCVAEGDGSHVLQYGHLDGAVSTVEQRHQGPGNTSTNNSQLDSFITDSEINM